MQTLSNPNPPVPTEIVRTVRHVDCGGCTTAVVLDLATGSADLFGHPGRHQVAIDIETGPGLLVVGWACPACGDTNLISLNR